MPRRPAPKLATEDVPDLSEVERLTARCRILLPRLNSRAGQLPAYDSLPLCVIDSVWSLSVRYDTVKAVLSRYAAWANLPDPFTAQNGDIADATISVWTFIADMERTGIEAFANEVFCNRQRTSTQGGILKAEAVYRFALALRNHGADTIADVASLRGDPAFERDIFAIPGQRSGISLRYFYMLCGASDLIKPDRQVLAFVAEAIGRGVTPDEAADLLTAACAVLTPECPDLTPRALDHAIWRFQREEGGGGVSGEEVASFPSPRVPSGSPLPSEGERGVTDSRDGGGPISPDSGKVIGGSTPLSPSEGRGDPEGTRGEGKDTEAKPTPQGQGQTEAPVEETDDSAEITTRYTVRIRELPSDERPRERLIHHGPEALSTAELLAILLRTGTEQRSAVGLAEHLLSEHGGLRGVAQLTVEEMSKIHGLGPAKAAQIKAAIEFGRRLVSASPEERPKIRCPQDVYNLIGPGLRDEKREHFIALLLDTKGGVMRQRTVSIGDLSSSIVHPREVFLEAIRHSAASLIVAHNHPSGDPTPSSEDVAVTRRLVEAGEMLGIDVLDHVIVGDSRWYSLKEKGLM